MCREKCLCDKKRRYLGNRIRRAVRGRIAESTKDKSPSWDAEQEAPGQGRGACPHLVPQHSPPASRPACLSSQEARPAGVVSLLSGRREKSGKQKTTSWVKPGALKDRADFRVCLKGVPGEDAGALKGGGRQMRLLRSPPPSRLRSLPFLTTGRGMRTAASPKRFEASSPHVSF